MKGLAERGHDVTIITPYTEKNLPKKGSYKQIELTEFEGLHDSKFSVKLFEFQFKKI